MRPRVGGTRPMAARSSVVLPAPLGPISTVGAPGAIVSVRRSRIVTRRRDDADVDEHDRQVEAVHACSSRVAFAGAPHAPGQRVDR